MEKLMSTRERKLYGDLKNPQAYHPNFQLVSGEHQLFITRPKKRNLHLESPAVLMVTRTDVRA